MKKTLIPLAAGMIFGGMQLVPAGPRAAKPPDPAHAIGRSLDVPPTVARILERSCGDCHSSATRWPWYSRVAPVSWMVESDVRKGRSVMNLSEWSNGAGKTDLGAAGVLAAACSDVQTRRMPPANYLLLHPKNRLSPADVSTLCGWTARESRHLAGMRRAHAPAPASPRKAVN